MRLNKYIAASTGMSRRAADDMIAMGRVTVNGRQPSAGQQTSGDDVVRLDGKVVSVSCDTATILLNKPAGYVCSRDGQGSPTIYDLLPHEMHTLKSVGRLDKDSSGLLLLTNDGQLAQELTHPKYTKQKTYEIRLDAPLEPLHHQMIADRGIMLDDGTSRLGLERLDMDGRHWRVIMHEGRNRQIRRTFGALGYDVRALHRTGFGSFTLDDVPLGTYRQL